MRLATHIVLLVATLAVLAHKGRPESHIKSRERRFLRNTGNKSSVPVRRDLRALLTVRKRLARIKRQLMTAPPKSVKVEIKFKEDWLDKMADKNSSQYKLMDGNIIDAVATELIGDSDFLDSRVMTLKKSDDSKPKVLSDIDFNFITEEQDPVRHLRAIVAQGRISGLLVYPDYFNLLKDEQPSQKPAYPIPTNSSTVNSAKEFVFDLKLKQDWYPFLSDQSSSPSKTLSDEIKKTIKQLFADDPYFIGTDVIGFTKDKDGHTHARILLKFRPGEKDPGKRLKDMVLAGKLGNIPVFDDYFNGQLPKPRGYKIINPPVPPPMATVPPTQEISTVVAKPPVPVLPTAQWSPTQQQGNQQLNVTQPATEATQPTAAAFMSPVPTAPPASTAPAAQSKSFDGEVKLQMDWYPFLADRNSFSYKSISGTIEDAIKQAYAPTLVIVEVNGLSKDPNGKLIASFNIRFPPGLPPSIAPLQGALSKGFLGGLPVFSSSQNITTPLVGIIPIGAPIFSADSHDTYSASTAAPLNVPLAAPTPPTPPATTPAPTTQVQVADTLAPATPPQLADTPTTPAPTPAPATQVQVADTLAPATPPQLADTPTTPAPTPATQVQVADTKASTTPAQVRNTTAPTLATIPPASPTPAAFIAPPLPTQVSTAQATSNAQSASAPLSDVPNYPYNGGLIPLPEGMPRSCADIRSSGIGTMDGEYVIQAKPACHLNIICQNMDEPLPKEYLGGPQQRVWLYWHYAVLIKLSDYDKKHIADQACLEKTAVGRDFINKVMLAGARQGNPLIPFKTNIKHMINKFIGKAKKRRSLEKDITISTRATRIYKKFAF